MSFSLENPSIQEELSIEGVWVETLPSCPHVSSASQSAANLPHWKTLCETCKDSHENWLCLTCHTVQCSRYRGAHMAKHIESQGHYLAMGFRDLSVWCFECEAYIDGRVNKFLKPHFDAVYEAKFGINPPIETVNSGESSS